MRKAMSFFNTFMLVFAVVALLVGGFIIFNTFSITIAQRTGKMGCCARSERPEVRCCARSFSRR